MPFLYLKSALFESIPIAHGFTLNSSPLSEVRAQNERTGTAKQVHKDNLIWMDALEKGQAEADAIATTNSSLCVGVYSADCAPILVAALNGQKVPAGIMAIHAGWRGTALKIAEKSLLNFQARFPLHRFLAVIGPCISFESFEVGEEVVAAFPGAESLGLARYIREEMGKKKYLFHLAGENERQLRDCAKTLQINLQIETMQRCTLREAEHFPSFRRDKANAGRILSFIGPMR